MIGTCFRKLVLISSAILVIGYTIVKACADGWFYYDYDSNFTPEVFADQSYSPLFFAPNEMFYGNGFDTNYNGRFNDIIVNDWSDYLTGSITKDKISYLLLNDSASASIVNLYESSRKQAKILAPFQDVPLSDPRVKGFIEFLFHAKKIEQSSLASPDAWDYEPKASKRTVSAGVVTAVEQLYNDTKDPFLKNRFWFQTLKAYFYSENMNQVIAFFERTRGQQPKNSLYYRGLSYVAGVHYRQKDYARANYLYSIVFDEYPPLRQVAAYNFHPKEDADFNGSLSLAKSNQEKAALWAMLGYYDDELTAIREIYVLDPQNKHLSYLLTRLINKQEVAVNNLSFNTAGEYKKGMKDNVNKEAVALIEQIANGGKAAEPSTWQISAGYLNIFIGNYQQAEHYFSLAVQKQSSEEVLRQVRLLRLINTICSLQRIDAAGEKKLLSELQWMHEHCGNAAESFRCSHVINWSHKYIALLYHTQQNRIMAELFDHSDTYYRDNGNLRMMKSFLKKGNYSEWEKFVLKLYPISLANIQEYEAVMATFTDDIETAIDLMNESTGGDVELLGNPFNGKIKDCHDCDHAAVQKIKYTKLSLLVKMKEMKDNVEAGIDEYNNSLLLANAYYNLTYHGNARVFYENKVLNQYGNDIDHFYHPQLLSCVTAQRYYERALAAATNPEQKAKCLYMIAKCERNEYYNKTFYSESGDFDENFVSWNAFKNLHSDYSNTKYYQDVLKECGYFRRYVRDAK